MSKQTSFITFQGNMGKVNFYKRKGEHVARTKSGTSKSKIMNDPKMQRVRENMSEFGALAQTRKSFGRAINPASKLKDGALSVRMAKIFRIIIKRSSGIRGQRSAMISQNRNILEGLELNINRSLMEVFAAKPLVSHAEARNEATIQVENVDVRDMVTAPPTATHFRLVQLLGVISDTVFDEGTNRYVAADEKLNGSNQMTFSDYISIKEPAVTFTMTTSLAGAPALTENVSVLQGLGILFYEKLGDEYYVLGEGTAMQIISVF